MLRGSRDFACVADYEKFLRQLLGPAERGAAASAWRRSCGVCGRCRSGGWRAPASGGAGGLRQHHPRGPQRLLGEQPPDRRAGGGAAVARTPGGLVCRQQVEETAAAAGPGQASRRLPAHHRLAGAQARRLRALPLSRGPVPHQPVPHGLRRCVKPTPGVPTRVPGDPAPGGARERGGVDRGAAQSARSQGEIGEGQLVADAVRAMLQPGTLACSRYGECGRPRWTWPAIDALLGRRGRPGGGP